jgi:hypothetical protein
MEFRYLLGHFKTLCITFFCMAFLGHPVSADEVIESAAPIKQTAFFKNTGDISDRELTDILAEILNETSKAKSVEINGFEMTFYPECKKVTARKVDVKISQNGRFVFESEVITEGSILENNKKCFDKIKGWGLREIDDKEVWIWDGKSLSCGFVNGDQFSNDQDFIDITNESELIDGAIDTEGLHFKENLEENGSQLWKLILTDTHENLQKKEISNAGNSKYEFLLVFYSLRLNPRRQIRQMYLDEMTNVFDVKNKDISQIGLEESGGMSETFFYVNSVKQLPNELKINSKQVLKKFKSKYEDSTEKESGFEKR